MSNIVKSNGNLPALTKRDEAICKVINRFNQLRSFRLDPIEILEWKDSLNRVFGEKMDLGALDFAIDKMISGELEYDKNLGIQNIISAMRQVEKTKSGYRIKNMVW